MSTFRLHGEVSVIRLRGGEVVFSCRERLSLSPHLRFALQIPGDDPLPRLLPIEEFTSLPVLPPLLYTARLGAPLADASRVLEDGPPEA